MGSTPGIAPCSLMSFATSDLEVQEEVVAVAAAVGTMKNEHNKRKVVVEVVAAVSKLNLCGRIIKRSQTCLTNSY